MLPMAINMELCDFFFLVYFKAWDFICLFIFSFGCGGSSLLHDSFL